jgi:peptide/nickel transport system permease protein
MYVVHDYNRKPHVPRLIVTRLLDAVLLLAALSLVTFGLLKSARGDLVDALYGDSLDYLSPAQIAQIRANLGLDQPLPVQYMNWLRGLAHGDLGRAAGDQRPVASIIAERLPYSLALGASALALALCVGVALGVLAATHADGWADRLVQGFAAAATAVPGFWLALGLILAFSLGLRWLPSSGPISPDGQRPFLLDVAVHAILPVTALALREMAVFARFTRGALLDVLHADCIRTARAKGLAEGAVHWRHAFPQVQLPLITLVGLQLPSLVGGAVAVETVFAWPGMGRLFVDAALKRDFATLAAAMLLTSTLVIGANLVADIAYAVADPRVAGPPRSA